MKPTPQKPHVALDIDGVLFPWDEAAADALERKFGYEDLLRDPAHWNHLKDQVSKEHFGWLFTAEGSEATLRQTLHYPGVPSALHWLGRNAHLTFITHRPTVAAAATAMWIAELGCPFESLHVVGRNGNDHLPKWAVKPEADVYVEDRADNVKELLYNTEHAFVLMPRRKYNDALWDGHVDSERDPAWDHRLEAYDDFPEVVEFVKGMYA